MTAVLDVEVQKTWIAIQSRLEHNPVSQVVPETAMELLDAVVNHYSDEAFGEWPTQNQYDRANRAHFWKQKVLQVCPEGQQGLYAVYLHEYIAATLRGDAAEMDDVSNVPHYGGHARASHDAWVACTASLL